MRCATVYTNKLRIEDTNCSDSGAEGIYGLPVKSQPRAFSFDVEILTETVDGDICPEGTPIGGKTDRILIVKTDQILEVGWRIDKSTIKYVIVLGVNRVRVVVS